MRNKEAVKAQRLLLLVHSVDGGGTGGNFAKLGSNGALYENSGTIE